MKVIIGVLLVSLALANAERDWSKVFPNHLPNPAGTRLPHGLPSSRIVGGTEAPPNSIPYQVALFLPVQGGTSFCGGSLISRKTVLTAAHCVDSLVGPVEVVLGAHNVRDDEATQVRVTTSSINIHPGWSALTLRNDLALIRLPNEVELSDNIQPIALASDTSNTFEGHEATASGWGLDSDSSTSISPILRKVTIPVIANSVCNIAYFGVIQDSHICASGLGGKSTCNGDSGGPLTVAGVQVGITSFGIALGCEIGWPPAFTRVSYFYDWIIANID
ncbi:hypothetical protein NQ317_004559 [Molorchus minor]|uniref:Peptidase S1 domain-containing protein n=1 Tax=Molorchus minor TaxID=1323400 RepID=A0ABQ9JY67_9CUCU|nr:hypothetical protein NQ317_004559 [Molorchus minor]